MLDPEVTKHHERLLIIDFGSQVTQLIARRLRELNVYCEIHPFQKVTDAFLDEFAPKAVIFSGGPASVFAEGAPKPPEKVFSLGVPILGICYGQQVMMQMLGGKVERGHGTAEFGRAYVTPSEERIDILNGWFLEGREQVWMSHGDHVSEIAPGFEVVQSHFPDWKFRAPDCTAAFGLHGALIVGAPLAVTDKNRAEIAAKLPTFEATLARGGEIVDRGLGANVLDSPALALADLARVLSKQPQFPPLAAGEVVTTGTVTDAWPIAPGETWSSDYGALGLQGLTVTFT